MTVTAPAKVVIARALPDALKAGDHGGTSFVYDEGESVVTIDGSFLSTEVADAILAALESAGYVVAPREPTEAMVKAAWMSQPAGPCCDWDMEELYRAMIAAQESKP